MKPVKTFETPHRRTHIFEPMKLNPPDQNEKQVHPIINSQNAEVHPNFLRSIYQKQQQTHLQPKQNRIPQIRMTEKKLQMIGGQFSSQLKLQAELKRSHEQLRRKQQLIIELRKMVNILTEQQRYRDDYEFEQSDLRTEIRVLTIQNQKLLAIIQKLHRKQQRSNSFSKDNSIREDMQEELKNLQQYYQKKIQSLNSQKDAVLSHCKGLENSLKSAESENKYLTKILEEKQQKSQPVTENVPRPISDQASKIKRQYQQNLSIIKQNISIQLQGMLDTIQLTLQQINSKQNKLDKKLQSLQKDQQTMVKMYQAEGKKLRNSIDASIINQKRIKDSFNDKIDILAKENSQLKNQIQSISRSSFRNVNSNEQQQKIEPNKNQQELQQIKRNYESIIEQKQQDINCLQSELKSLKNQQEKKINYEQYEKLQKIYTTKIDEIIQIKTLQIQQLKQQHQVKINQMKYQFEEQIKNIQRELIRKNASLNQFDQMDNIRKLQLESEIEMLRGLANHLENQYKTEKENYEETILSQQLTMNKLALENQRLLERQIPQPNQQRQQLIQKLTQENKRLKNQLKDKKQTIVHLCNQLEDLQSQNDPQFKGYKEKIKINQNLEELSSTIHLCVQRPILPQLYHIKRQLQSQLSQDSRTYSNGGSPLKKQFLTNEQNLISNNCVLSHQTLNLRDKINQYAQTISILEQKIYYLQSNNQIYERQLKQRKKQYQELIHEKSMIQRQLIEIRKSKSQNNNQSESSRNMWVKQISDRINKLIQLQQSRDKQMNVQIDIDL